MTPNSRLSVVFALAALLVSCDDSSSSSSSTKGPSADSDISFEGTWTGTLFSEAQTLEFRGQQLHRREFIYGCLVSESWGRFAYTNSYLRVTPDSLYVRGYGDAADSATACKFPISRATVSGSIATFMENVTASRFVERTVSIYIGSEGSFMDTLRWTFVKQ